MFACLVVVEGSRLSLMVEAAHRVIDTGRSITEVVAGLTLDENALGVWVRAERA